MGHQRVALAFTPLFVTVLLSETGGNIYIQEEDTGQQRMNGPTCPITSDQI